MRGTRLWQDTGSPLISGRSRREKPFWKDWLWGTLLGLALYAASISALIEAGAGSAIDALPIALVPAVPVAVLAAAATVWLSAKFGWRRRWLSSAVVAWAFTAAVFLWSGQFLLDTFS